MLEGNQKEEANTRGPEREAYLDGILKMSRLVRLKQEEKG